MDHLLDFITKQNVLVFNIVTIDNIFLLLKKGTLIINE